MLKLSIETYTMKIKDVNIRISKEAHEAARTIAYEERITIKGAFEKYILKASKKYLQ